MQFYCNDFDQNGPLQQQLIHTEDNTARFYVVAMRKTLNWGKWWVKKFNLAPFALRTQGKLVYGARNTSVCLVLSSRIMKLSRAGKQVVESHIVSHVSEKLWKSTKRSNVMIQMNPAKIEIYRSRRTVFYKEKINCGAKI